MENYKKINLNFYGVKVQVSGDAHTIGRLEADFAYFCTPSETDADVKLSIFNSQPDYSKVPRVKAKIYKENSISYDFKKMRYTNYKNEALSVYDFKTGNGEAYSQNADLLYEISYLFIHSRAGELLDLKGFHRLHAAAISYNNNIFVLMLPSGGGKTTFLMEALKNPAVKILSDDTPLINPKGEILPFPLRIGVIEGEANDIAGTTIFNRSAHGAKQLIPYEYFSGKIEPAKLPVTLICADRFFSPESEIIKINKLSAAGVLFKNLITGYGIPQVVEFFIKLDLKDFFVKAYIAVLRSFGAVRFLLKCKQACYFKLGYDKKNNLETFLSFFK
jgi:hypothetical protein